MEPALNTTNTMEIPQNGALPVSGQDVSEVPDQHRKKNFYPEARHILLIIFILLGLTIIFFLIHQNGKSIYENGL